MPVTAERDGASAANRRQLHRQIDVSALRRMLQIRPTFAVLPSDGYVPRALEIM